VGIQNATLTVKNLTNTHDAQWYECWCVSPKGKVATAGTFLVPDSGTGTFSMTAAADPADFPTMEVRLETPDKTGARQGGRLVLRGRGQKL